MAITFQLRGDTATNWAAANPVLAERELVLVTDTNLLKMGDGSTAFNSLPYFAGGDVDPADFVDLQDEVIEARGNRTRLDFRIEAISRYASPCAASLGSGEVLDNSQTSTAPTTLAGTANAIRLVPFMTSRPLTIDAIGGRVTTAGAAGALARYLIYGSDADGWPDEKLWEASEDLPTTVVGPIYHTGFTFTFDADRVYWLGIRYGLTCTITGLQPYSAPNLGLLGGMNGTTYGAYIQRVVAFASPAPNNWAFVPAERVAGNPPAIRMQVA